jgi:ankyrin repeat protein
MNHASKTITIACSLLSVVAITMITHFALTHLPEETQRNIDVETALKVTDVNAFDAVTGLTPLMQAAIDSDPERTRILLAQGANPNIVSANADRDNALNLAIFNGGKLGSLAVAQLLMESGADINAKNARGMAPIHFMMQITNAENRWIIFKDLMARGAHINDQNEDGSTMMHITVTNLDYDWIDRLNTEYGQIINYNIRDKRGRTPLDLAIERGLTGDYSLGTQSVENSIRKRPRLIGDDFDTKATDVYGRNGLELAVMREDMPFVQALVGAGADLAHQDGYGNTALHYAVLNLNPRVYVQYLLQAKAPVNIANEDGETPLFNVVKISNKIVRNEIAKMLINAGSPVTNKNNAGKTIMDLAAAAQDAELINTLRDAIEKRRKS